MSTVSASVLNLRHLFWIRVLLSTSIGCALAYTYFQLHLPLNYPVLLILLGLFAASTVALAVRATPLRRTATQPITPIEYFLQLLVDIALFSAVLYFSGGASNPFISYYLVPLSISAAILPWGYTWAIAGITLGCYTLLMMYNQPIAALSPMDHGGGHEPMASGASGANLHIVGMWVNYLISTLVITFFVVKMANALRRQQQDLVNQREDELRDQQIMAVATLAAGTAHELGTPLATMSVLLKEMADTEDADNRHDIELLQDQVARCKNILQKLSTTAETHSHKQTQVIPTDKFLRQVIEHWQLLKPGIPFQMHLPEAVGPCIAAESSLEQALINLLNNAARVTRQQLLIEASWHSDYVKIAIIDDGPGIPMEIAEQLGKPFVTTKGGGMGLGLFLTHASIERIGGRITLYNRDHGGACAEVILPIQSNTAGNRE